MIRALALFLALLWPLSGHAADQKPPGWFCAAAKAAVLAAGSEKAAEDAARSQGFSEATIAKARRCKR